MGFPMTAQTLLFLLIADALLWLVLRSIPF